MVFLYLSRYSKAAWFLSKTSLETIFPVKPVDFVLSIVLWFEFVIVKYCIAISEMVGKDTSKIWINGKKWLQKTWMYVSEGCEKIIYY